LGSQFAPEFAKPTSKAPREQKDSHRSDQATNPGQSDMTEFTPPLPDNGNDLCQRGALPAVRGHNANSAVCGVASGIPTDLFSFVRVVDAIGNRILDCFDKRPIAL
jgi:hypothetical protein